MKKKLKKLTLQKETLRALAPQELNPVAGADPSDWSHMMNEDSQTCTYGVHEQEPIIVEV